MQTEDDCKGILFRIKSKLSTSSHIGLLSTSCLRRYLREELHSLISEASSLKSTLPFTSRSSNRRLMPYINVEDPFQDVCRAWLCVPTEITPTCLLSKLLGFQSTKYSISISSLQLSEQPLLLYIQISKIYCSQPSTLRSNTQYIQTTIAFWMFCCRGRTICYTQRYDLLGGSAGCSFVEKKTG